jgi:tetratricopeptide (TPR) repeat protein
MTVPGSGTPVASVPTIWGYVPRRNKNFTGRAETLARLRQGMSSGVTAVLLRRGPKDPVPQAIQGLGGVGKTSIAVEYAYRYRSAYDLVWWIPADQLPLARASLAALAERLGLETAMRAGTDSAIQAVLDALRRGDPFSRWLLIFDNADQPEDIIDLLPHGPGDVLITSRNHRWQSLTDIVPLDVFDREESKDFLARRVPRPLTDGDTDRLAEQLGDLPLALGQAGALLAETGMPVDEYLRLLNEHVSRIMSEGKAPDYPFTMTAAWKLSAEALARQLPQARELLNCCAFFSPEPIPRDLFRQGGQATGTRLGGVASDPILLAKAIRELGRFGLVTIDVASISVHRLVGALIRDELDPDQQAAYRREVHLFLAAGAPRDPDDQARWARYRELLPHVASAQLGESREPAVRDLALNTMRYLYQSGDYSSCVTLTERFLKQWTMDSGADSRDVMQAERQLGDALRLLGRYPESFALTEQALAKSRAVLGDRDSLTLRLRLGRGADLRARGDFRAARELDEETRILVEEVFGPEDPWTMRVLSGLSLDHALNSDYATARDLYRQVLLPMSQVAAGTTATDVLTVWNGLASALRLTGAYHDALDVIHEALEYGQETLGAEHLATLRSTNGFTIVCRHFPEWRAEALDIARNNLAMCRRSFDDSHPDTLAVAISLSNLLRTTSEDSHAEAMRLAADTAARYPSAYGSQHPYYYGCLGNLALLTRVTGDAQAARRLNSDALAGFDSRLGRDHHYTLTVATNLASDLAVLGFAREARDLGEDTLSRLAALLGADHPVTLGCAANLALDMIAAGDEDGGRALQARTVARYRQTLGDQHPDTVVAVWGGRLDPDFDPPPI